MATRRGGAAALLALLGCAALGLAARSAAAWPSRPIIDVHLHAYPADAQGPPPVAICAPYTSFPPRDGREDGPGYFTRVFKIAPPCRHPVWSSRDDAALRRETLAMLERYDITAVASGPADMVAAWQAAAPARIIPGLEFGAEHPPSLATIRALHHAGRLKVLGEIGAQYDGAGPDDPRLEPYWALAEELDLPVGIHMGPGPPGAPYFAAPRYRMALSDPLALEPVLVRHPRLRLYVMHAGWPMADRMIALLYAQNSARGWV